MDEAARCHEIAYIAFGRVLARGTVSEVIENSHLTTFTVDAANGENLAPLARELATRAGVDTVAPFGASLHVSGRDGAALEAAIASYQTQPGLHWQRSSASLEDVFIALMAAARDNFE
jgi:ABC-2 type transport system ATP-binding protein